MNGSQERLPVTNKGSSTMRGQGQSSLGLSRGRSGGCRPRRQRLGLGGRGAPAQFLDSTQDPLHVSHFGYAKVLQQRGQPPWMPGRGPRPKGSTDGSAQRTLPTLLLEHR